MKALYNIFQIALITFLCFPSLLTAQHPVYYTIDEKDGLPTNEVYEIAQDNFGYVWIGCDAGLYRYDGFEFKPYKSSSQNSRSVSSLQLDANGRIWCRNFTGQILRTEGDSLQLMVDMNGTQSFDNQYTLDDKSNVWFFLNGNLVQMDDARKIIKQVPVSMDNNSPLQHLKFFHGKIYYTTVEGELISFDIANIKQNHVGDLQKNAKHSLFVWRDTLRVQTFNQIERRHVISNIISNAVVNIHEYISSDKNPQVHQLAPVSDGTLWICTADGAFPFDTSFNQLHEHKGVFKSFKVSYAMKDREGSYWFSTLQNGLLIIPSMKIKQWNNENASLPENNLSVMATFGNTLAIGSYTGKLMQLNENAKVTNVSLQGDLSIFNAKSLRTYNENLYAAHGRFTEVDKTGKSKSYPLYSLRDFVIVRDSVFYVMQNFIARIPFSSFKKGKIDRTILRKGGGQRMTYVKGENAFYFVLYDGFFRFINNQWDEVLLNGKSIHATSIFSNDKQVWLGTTNSGIVGIENGKVINQFNVSSGLFDNEFKSIYADNNTVWAGSNRYLYKLDLKANSIDYFSSSLGVNPSDINAIHRFHNMVYLATNKGLVSIPFDLQSVNSVKPSIKIQKITLDGAVITDTSKIGLPYANSNFEINFSSIAFRSRGNYNVEYRLLGLSNSWVQQKAENRLVTYASLPPGDYVFQLRSVNETGLRGDVATLKFYVRPALWQTWWFYVLASAFSVIVVIVVYSLRLRYVREQAAITNKLTASQLTALKAQMNPHFMYNALNSIQDLVIRRDVENSNHYLSQFSLLMRKVLAASGEDEITLQEEIDILSLYLELEKLRFGDEFLYEIKISNSVRLDKIHLPSMILQPFVENAIKHGLLHKRGEKQLTIEFIKNEMLECVITDNGVGRTRSAEIRNRMNEKHSSFSTQATEKRIELFTQYANRKFDFEIIDLYEDGSASGTKVIVRIPLVE